MELEEHLLAHLLAHLLTHLLAHLATHITTHLPLIYPQLPTQLPTHPPSPIPPHVSPSSSPSLAALFCSAHLRQDDGKAHLSQQSGLAPHVGSTQEHHPPALGRSQRPILPLLLLLLPSLSAA